MSKIGTGVASEIALQLNPTTNPPAIGGMNSFSNLVERLREKNSYSSIDPAANMVSLQALTKISKPKKMSPSKLIQQQREMEAS